MNIRTFILLIIAIIFLPSESYSQNIEKVSFDATDSTAGYYLAIPSQSKKINGVVVLLSSFLPPESLLPETKLHNVAYVNDIITIVAFMKQKLYADSSFKVIAFYTAKKDLGHISFVHEANKWFSAMAIKYHFTYDSTKDWNNLNSAFLFHYQVVVFLDSRPDVAAQRNAFKQYMDSGGGWMGFHFAGFALSPSAYPQNWDWYHNQFLGAGEYKSNTWRPTAAILRVEDHIHPATKLLPQTFKSSPNEWYRWNNDLRTNSNIKILLSIDSSAFPLGTGPKPYEIWHSGYYPVVWTNTKYKMIYLNMGHNDMDYEHKSNKELSSTFSGKFQNQLIIDALLWLGNGKLQGIFKK